MEAGVGDMIRISSSADDFGRLHLKGGDEATEHCLGQELRVTSLKFNQDSSEFYGT